MDKTATIKVKIPKEEALAYLLAKREIILTRLEYLPAYIAKPVDTTAYEAHLRVLLEKDKKELVAINDKIDFINNGGKVFDLE
jgi:hypothetical protein